jgi:hypothetical protein
MTGAYQILGADGRPIARRPSETREQVETNDFQHARVRLRRLVAERAVRRGLATIVIEEDDVRRPVYWADPGDTELAPRVFRGG